MENINSLEKGLNSYLKTASDLIKYKMSGYEWIVFDIIEMKKSNSHYYLEIGELDRNKTLIASSRATIWASKSDYILSKFKKETGFDLSKNTKIMAFCSISLSPKFGLSININDINPTYTVGVNKSNIKEILGELDKFGITNNNKQKKTPQDFKNVIVLSPDNAAGLGDFKSDADKLSRFNICNFHYHSAIFQGEKTESSIMDELRNIFKKVKDEDKYDALVIIRGGGSTTDLNHLNSKSIARAICLFNIPVYIGVGHERDETVLDYVGNMKFDTPSKVISFIRNKIISNYESTINAIDKIKSHSKNTIDNYNNQITLIKKDNLKNAISLIHGTEREVSLKHNNIKNGYEKIVLELSNYIENYKVSIIDKAKNNINKNIEYVDNKKNQIIRGIDYELRNNLNLIDSNKNNIIKNITSLVDDNLKDNSIKLVYITTAISRLLDREFSFIDNIFLKIDKHNPSHIKKLGYSIIKINGKTINSIDKVPIDSEIIIELNDGLIYTKVSNITRS